MLSIRDLHAQIGVRKILKGVNLEVKPGEVHAIMGPNGSGKSTLASVLAGRAGYEVTKGTAHYLGDDLLEGEPGPEAVLDAVLAEDVPERLGPAVRSARRQDGHPGVDRSHSFCHGVPFTMR